MDFSTAFLIIFGIGTLILAKYSKLERHFIVFLIRTSLFLNLLRKIANISKKFWKLFADLAIIFSFSGLGAAYLSKYRRLNKNLDFLFVLISSFLILSFSGSLIFTFLLFLSVILIAGILHNLKNQIIDFLVFSLIIYFSWLKIFYLIIRIGLIGEISNSLILHFISLIGGIFGVPGLLALSFLYQGYLIVFQNLNIPGVSPFLPATKGGEVGFSAPGTNIFIPIWYFLSAIIITIIFHEFAHGILARAHQLRLKSTGLVLLGIVPIGAFVEPDEEELKKRKSLERMRIFSVGSFSNFLVALIFFIFLFFSSVLIAPFFSDGIMIIDTQEGYPAFNVIKKEVIVYEVNAMPTRTIDEFKEAMEKINPGERVDLKTSQGKINLTAGKNPENPQKAYLGVILIPHLSELIYQFLFWTFFINLSISLVNLLPILPLDGGRMLKELVESFNLKKRSQRKIIQGVVTLILLLILINLWPLFKGIGSSITRLF